MIDVEPLIREELERRVPPTEPDLADWGSVLRRAGEPGRRRRLRSGAVALLIVAALALAASPLGGAIVRGVGGFSSWLVGEPGKPAAETEQQRFEQAGERSWADFPERPALRELIHAEVGGATYTLYGFRSGNAFCLRLVVLGIRGAGPQLGCLPRHELEQSRDLAIPLKANVGFGHVGRLPRTIADPPTVSRALASFGFAADSARRIELVSDDGTSPALLASGAFLHVLDRPSRGTWIRSALARDESRRAHVVPILLATQEQPSGSLPLSAKGPARVERQVRGGTIGWFTQREPRGAPLEGSPRLPPRLGACCLLGAFARVIQPDARDFLRMLVAESDLGRQPEGEEICRYLITRGGVGGGCAPAKQLFSRGPLALSWGFSGVGQQFWIVSGLASDEVARVEVFLGTGEQRPAPLRDNVVIVRVQAAKFPARIVAYDARGRVIGIETIGAQRGDGARPVGAWRVVLRAQANPGPLALLHVARSSVGGRCLQLELVDHSASRRCYPASSRRPLELSQQSTRRAAFVYGRAAADVASVELRYRDGDVETVKPVRGLLLHAVPSRHARDGHRLTIAVARDAEGNEVTRQRLGSQPAP